jgi:hypothetical protein
LKQGLFDNDISIKLVASGLLRDALELFQIEETFILNSFQYQLKPGKSGKLAQRITGFSEDIRIQISNFVEQATPLTEAQDHDFVRQCLECQFDIGEILLLEKALYLTKPILLTADKRFLLQLAEYPIIINRLRDDFDGKFVCLETILWQLIEKKGYESILDKVRPVKDKINELKVVFGGEHDKSENQARDRLSYELNRIREKVDTFLYSSVI